MKTRVSISFWFKKSKSSKNQGTDPLLAKGKLVCRITVRGTRRNLEVPEPITRQQWDLNAAKVLGNTPEAMRLNRVLTKLKNDLYDIHADLERQGKPVTATIIKHLYQRNGSPLSLLDVLTAFMVERRTLIGVEISKVTLKSHQTRYNKLTRYLTQVLQQPDLRPEEFTHSAADKLLHWLLLTEQYQRNTALKTLQMVSQALGWAMRREYLEKNPLDKYAYKLAPPKDLVYLEAEELEQLSCFEFASDPLGRVRDCFVFQCWTGLAYADMKALDVAKCVEVHNGRRVLRVRRAKSTIFRGYECVIPLLPEAERILAHYQDQLPVVNLQYYNRSIKQITMMCGIKGKEVTSHVGRKTAGVLLLNAGIPMEIVSKVLGHSSVKLTEKVYAKILDRTVVNEIERVFGPVVPPPSVAPGFAPEEREAPESGRVIPFRLGA